MTRTEEEITRARQHVLDGERLIREQRTKVARRRAIGLPIAEAEQFLRIMEDIQDQFRGHLRELTRT